MNKESRRGPGRPRAVVSRETRARIIQAARDVFGECGWAASTFQAIAMRSGVTRPAINYYFVDKRALYNEAVAVTCAAAYEEGMAQVRAETDLAATIVAFVKSAGTSPAALMVTALQEAQRDAEMKAEAEACVDAVRRFLVWALTEAIATGEIDGAASANLDPLTEMLISVVFGLFLLLGYAGDPMLDPQRVHALLAIHLHTPATHLDAAPT